MKGFLTLCSAVLALLKVVCIPAEAQDAEMTDTLARAVISSSRPAIASTGLKRFDGGELLGGAAILGSPDVVKFLQNLPGVASGMELMSGLYVRGGDCSDNLFMLDGVPLFQVSHLAGIFSSFNTDVIESLDFYESGFPARYGGRLSSIVDIRTKNGSMEDFGGSVSVGLIDGRINLNGPIVRNKLSYDIAIRRSWLDALVAPVLAIENSGNKTKTNGGYALFDSNLNLTYTDRIRPSDSHQVTAGTYVRLSRKLHLDVSGYYRSIENCLIYSGNGSLFPSIDRWEDEFVSGRGRSYGAEIELQYLSGKFRGSAFYTLSWSERKFDALLDSWFRDRFDNRHKLTLTGSWRINEHIDINATWNFHSGNRVTVPEHTVSLPDGGFRFLFSEPYNAKLPDYHRLDISCNFRKRTKRGNERIWNISIYNAYCRMNPIMMRVTNNEELKPVAIGYSFVPIIPSFSYTLKF